jgi:hypothetical protein
MLMPARAHAHDGAAAARAHGVWRRRQVKVKVTSGGQEAELRVAVRASETGHHLRYSSDAQCTAPPSPRTARYSSGAVAVTPSLRLHCALLLTPPGSSALWHSGHAGSEETARSA